MDFLKIVGVIAAIVAGVYLLLTLVGYVAPRRATGMALLCTELRKRGVNPAAFDQAMLREIVATSVLVGRAAGILRKNSIVAFAQNVKHAASMTADVVQGRRTASADMFPDSILIKYGVAAKTARSA